ncbi:spherulation-specific family 4 protein [Streptomyces sp. NPDC006475]|uniref:spherulation-specific family 4 protein n=1 Tax=Streptomyces sp. NPDC006475 TaxID=3155719 RepID=UPI0033A99FEF
MPRSARILACAAVTVVAALTVAALPAVAEQDETPSPAESGQKVSVPAYFYPGAHWDRLIDSGEAIGMAVANPASGPGSDADEQYTATMRKADSAGVDVIGYVPTGYFGTTGTVTRGGSLDPAAWMEQIKSDVDTWYALYGAAGLDGIFFDEGLADCGPEGIYVGYYVELKEYVENTYGTEAIVVDNPGTGTQECYTRAADTLVTFEGSGTSYQQHEPQAWEANALSGQIWHLVYDVPDAARTAEAVSLAKERNAGHVYLTDDTMADQNPWDTLPPAGHWDAQLDQGGQDS